MLAPFRRPLRLLRPYRWTMVAGALCPPTTAALGILLTDRIAAVLGALQEGGDGFDLDGACLVLLAIGLGIAVLRFLARNLLIQVSRRVERDLKDSLLAHLQRLPIAFFDRAGTGDLVSRMTQDVEVVRFMLGPAVLYGTSALVVVPGVLTVMATLSPLLTGAITVAFALLLLSSRRLMPRLQDASQRVQQAIGALSDRALEDFLGIRVLLAFGRARAEERRMAGMAERYLTANIDLTRLRALYNLMLHVSSDFVTLAVLVVGGYEVLRGGLTVPELFQFLLLLGMVTWPLIAIGWILSTYPRAKAAMQRIEEIFAHEVEPGARPDAAPGAPTTLRGDLEVRGLTFTYPGRDTPALQDVSFRLRAGEKLGLVGPVGSGKSTLLALLLRLYDPPRGTMFVDGHDILDLDPRVLRRTFAVAPQDPFLFSDTVEANVRFAAPDGATGEHVHGAVRVAALDQDLADLHAGLATVIGERGVTLSGGQKQRLSLARALFANRQALVLDDTLSAVDHATERRILAQLDRERRGRTALVASHRLSAIRDADRILVLEAGRVVQQGDHESLIREPGPYQRYHRLQTESDALEGGE
ncbi:MAG TPA: ABC transporter ATP-binding protein [Planctomycetota bacterium]|nr:ABC transporter ATP-binding protein [Planctomycetota bacterium]